MRFPYSRMDVAFVRALDSATWLHDLKAWRIAADDMSLRAVLDYFGVSEHTLPPDVRSVLRGNECELPPVDLSVAADHHFLTEPYQHQVRGLAELITYERWLLAWEMGTGKTHVVANRLVHGFQRHEFRGPVLVICPKSVLDVWVSELSKHARLRGVVFAGPRKKREQALAHAGDVLVTNYERARISRDLLARMQCDVVIADEAHRLKAGTNATSRAVRKIAETARYRWALTGTPSPNGPLDIFGIGVFLRGSRAFGTSSKIAFEARYAIKERIPSCGFSVVRGYRNLRELQERVAAFSSALKKEECLDLPPKIFVERRCALTGAAARVYRQLRDAAVARLESARGTGELTVQNVLTESLRLLQVCGGFVPDDDGTMHALEPNAKLALLEDVLQDTPKPVVIWAAFRAEVDTICRLLPHAVRVTGSESAAQRTEAIETFQSGAAPYFVGTPQAGGQGISLTAASSAIYYSRNWSLTDWGQSQDRIHRIGQTRKTTILSLIADGTIDDRIADALARKRSLQEIVLAGGTIDTLL